MLTGVSPVVPGVLLCNATRRLSDGKHVIIHQRVQGSVRAVRAVQNTRVFQTETRFVADALWPEYVRQSNYQPKPTVGGHPASKALSPRLCHAWHTNTVLEGETRVFHAPI